MMGIDEDVKSEQEVIEENVGLEPIKKNIIKEDMKPRGFMGRIKRWFSPPVVASKGVLEPLLVVVDGETNTATFFEGASEGLFRYGDHKQGSMLDRSKMVDIVLGNMSYRGWIVDKDKFSPYPENKKLDGEMVYKALKKISMNYGDLLAEGKEMKWLVNFGLGALVVLGIIGYILYKVGVFDGLLGVAKPVADVVVNNATQIVQASGVNVV